MSKARNEKAIQAEKRFRVIACAAKTICLIFCIGIAGSLEVDRISFSEAVVTIAAAGGICAAVCAACTMIRTILRLRKNFTVRRRMSAKSGVRRTRRPLSAVPEPVKMSVHGAVFSSSVSSSV